MPRALRAFLLGAVATAALSLSGAAQAATIHVQPGESIQAAIDAADPGDTIIVAPGVYHENLTIAKDNLRLRGAGLPGDSGRTVLEPGPTPTPSVCSEDAFVSGICVVGEFGPAGSGEPVTGTRIVGFTIQNFSGFGILLFNAHDSIVEKTQMRRNHGYGMYGIEVSGIQLVNNIANDNGEPGFYVGDSPDAHAVLRGNWSFRNNAGGLRGEGILLRDASHGVVRNNRVFENCAGIAVVDTGGPGAATDWRVQDNWVARNNGACAGEENGPPPMSGIGILTIGGSDIVVRGNRVVGHEPTGPSIPSAGITVLSGAAAGAPGPTDVEVEQNVLHDNSPFDVFWDESGTDIRFNNNECEVSQPSWICS